MQKRIHVAVGILVDIQGRVCIAKRPNGKHLGGLWEFPGGKLEENEEPFTGLKRELFEELGTEIQDAERFMEISYDYPGKMVLLDVFKSTNFVGNVSGKEGQEVKWVTLDQLNSFDFPAANMTIIEKLIALA